MTELLTSSYRAFRPEQGQAVVISLGLPRWRPEARGWPRCWLLTPTPELFHEPSDEVFERGYLARLDGFGAQKIAAALEQIAREHQAQRLLLLCHEWKDPETCHRRQFAGWWLQETGEHIKEATS